MDFIGIDLSWKVKPVKRKQSAVVVIEESGLLTSTLFLSSDSEIVGLVKEYVSSGCIVGVDSPLKVLNEVGQRWCENVLLKCGFGVLPSNRQIFDRLYGGVRGEILVNRLGSVGVVFRDDLECSNVVMEVYPYVAWRTLFGYRVLPRYKNVCRREKIVALGELRDKLLSSFLSPPLVIDDDKIQHKITRANLDEMSGRELDRFGDLLDAIIAAYTVYLFWKGGGERCIVIGDLNQGYILVPVDDFLRRGLERLGIKC